jgi:hypothetical protein
MKAAMVSLLLLHLPLWICGDGTRSVFSVMRYASEGPGSSGLPTPARFIVEPAVLSLRGGAALEGETRRQPSSLASARVKTPNSASARVKFGARPAKRAGDSAGRSDESSFARLGAPDGKHTPGISSSKRQSRLDLSSGDDDSARVDSGRDRDGSSVRFARLGAPDGKHTPGKTPATSSRGKRASAPSPSDDSARERDESSLRFARLGAPDGKHTPGKAPAASTRRKRAGALSPSDEDSVRERDESSVRFARLGAPDGKHTPASRRCAFASLQHGPLRPVPCLLLT